MLADHIPHTTKRWDVVIPGEPVAWQRAGRSRRGGHFTQTKTRRFEQALNAAEDEIARIEFGR